MALAESHVFLTTAGLVRNDWTRDEVRALFALPFSELLFEAARVHRQNFDPAEVQISTLLSIKTGGCPEDCAYCPQAARYDTGVKADKLMRRRRSGALTASAEGTFGNGSDHGGQCARDDNRRDPG